MQTPSCAASFLCKPPLLQHHFSANVLFSTIISREQHPYSHHVLPPATTPELRLLLLQHVNDSMPFYFPSLPARDCVRPSDLMANHNPTASEDMTGSHGTQRAGEIDASTNGLVGLGEVRAVACTVVKVSAPRAYVCVHVCSSVCVVVCVRWYMCVCVRVCVYSLEATLFSVPIVPLFPQCHHTLAHIANTVTPTPPINGNLEDVLVILQSTCPFWLATRHAMRCFIYRVLPC